MKFPHKYTNVVRLVCIMLCLICLGMAGKWPTVANIVTPADAFEIGSMRWVAGHPLKLDFYSTIDAPNEGAILESLKSMDTEDVLSNEPLAKDITDLDAIILFVNGWSDIKNLPDQDIWGPVYKRVGQTNSNVIGRSLPVSVNGRSIRFIFYNINTLKDKKPQCFAEDIFLELIAIHVKSFPLAKCS